MLLVGLGLLLQAAPASAQMTEALKEEFHDAEAYGVQVIGSTEVGRLRSLMADPDTRVLCLQIWEPDLPEGYDAEILEWVRQGKSVWFYDARLAPRFGMKPYYLDQEQFKHKDEKGELGGKKTQGYATVGLAHGSHPVVTGVGQVTVYLPQLYEEEGEYRYGAIEVQGDTVALLQFTVDSPALVALRRDGRGLVVFKSLLWTEPLSGDRFQSNLLEFSAGYQVPGPAGVGKVGNPPGPEAEYVETDLASRSPTPNSSPSPTASPAPTASPSPTSSPEPQGEEGIGDTMVLEDGKQLQGEIRFDSLRFETGTSSLTVTPDRVARLTIGGRLDLDTLELRDGNVYKGVALFDELILITEGKEEKYRKRVIKNLELSPRPQEPKKNDR